MVERQLEKADLETRSAQRNSALAQRLLTSLSPPRSFLPSTPTVSDPFSSFPDIPSPQRRTNDPDLTQQSTSTVPRLQSPTPSLPSLPTFDLNYPLTFNPNSLKLSQYALQDPLPACDSYSLSSGSFNERYGPLLPPSSPLASDRSVRLAHHLLLLLPCFSVFIAVECKPFICHVSE